jgi:hypothetical protein
LLAQAPRQTSSLLKHVVMRRSNAFVRATFAVLVIAVFAAIRSSIVVAAEDRADPSPFALADFGEIATTGEVKESLCLDCGDSVELIDSAGHVLVLSNGTLAAPPYSGLLIGCGSAEVRVVLPQSAEEAALLQRIWRFLDQHYWPIDSELAPGALRSREGTVDDRATSMILNILRRRRLQCEARRWLDNNLSLEEQGRLISRITALVGSEYDREVFRCLCLVRGGTCLEDAQPDSSGAVLFQCR